MGQAASTPAPPPATVPQQPPAGCPMHVETPPPLPPTAGGCPVDHSSMKGSRPAPKGELNPVNNMPELAQAPSPGQKMFLPLERTISSIPRASSSSSAGPSACPVAHTSSNAPEGSKAAPAPNKEDQWEYPSPQQFYNALVRKGWETPEESVEMMVNIHNWINEEAWTQVRKWEEKHDGGDRSMLASFSGRPQDISPKARYHMWMGKFFPNTYASIKPFDRHDWVVHRPSPVSSDKSYTAASPNQPYTSHRYVIDYYSLPDDSDGNPVFSLDVRPAVDDFAAVQERIGEWWKLKREAWGGAGGSDHLPPGVRVQEEK